ncbi:hypothetical protein MFIFM68171_04897 [Madurella fahalii]|uniref:Peptidase A1 domain-containing protein n=1 Tax=Madurella fahalii TaxID=1157608 RepID=A0ABQ0GA81_9PEZI
MLASTQQLFLSFCLLVSQSWAAPLCHPPTIELSLGDCRILGADEGEDVDSWGIRVSIDGASDLCLVPSTVVNHTFLTTDDLCGPDQLNAHGVQMSAAQCRSRRGGYISQPLSIVSTDGLGGANPGWGSLGNSIDSAAEATLHLLNQAVTMTVGLITSGQQSTASHLGLASGSVLLETLKNMGLIGARSFGLNVGSQSVLFPKRGSLVLGGYDQVSPAGSFAQFAISNPDQIHERHCPLQVSVTGMTLSMERTNNTAGNSTSLQSVPIIQRADPMRFCIEPYDNLFRMPGLTVDKVENYFREVTGYNGETVDPVVYRDRLLNLEPGLAFPASAGSFNGTLRLTIEDKLTVDIPLYELQRPLRGLDSNGRVVLEPEYNELQIYRQEAPNDAPVLGKAFLSQVYLFVDYESGNFYLAPQAPGVTTSRPISSTTCTTGLSPTDKGLITVGSVLGVILVVSIGYAMYRYCCAPLLVREKRSSPVSAPATDQHTTQKAGPPGHDAQSTQQARTEESPGEDGPEDETHQKLPGPLPQPVVNFEEAQTGNQEPGGPPIR